MSAPSRQLVAAALVALFGSGCRGPTSTDERDAATSPQAQAVPAPLAQAPAVSAQPVLTPDAGPPPAPLRGDQPVPADAFSAPKGDAVAGWVLVGAFRPVDLAPAPRPAEASAISLEALRKKAEPRLTVEMAPSRARVVLGGAGFALPVDTELRSRADRVGHVLLLPGAASYRAVPPGALRALLNERRLDVAPASASEVVAQGDGPKRLGQKTRKVEVQTRAGRATFELVRAPEVGDGGALFARALLDLVSAPGAAAVGADEIPVRVEYKWTRRGGLVFEATSLVRKADLAVSALVAPPPQATFTTEPIPSAPVVPLLPPADLAQMRATPVDVPVPPNVSSTGLEVASGSDEALLLYLDAIPVAWVSPRARGEVLGPPRGRYQAQFRSFLGDMVAPPTPVTVPGRADIQLSDAGAPW
ncbi:MAG: hypothetical protein JNL38_30290 [Myxococcales bacterium]|nr:hypothetical protein [Myxococcales bacterium]